MVHTTDCMLVYIKQASCTSHKAKVANQMETTAKAKDTAEIQNADAKLAAEAVKKVMLQDDQPKTSKALRDVIYQQVDSYLNNPNKRAKVMAGLKSPQADSRRRQQSHVHPYSPTAQQEDSEQGKEAEVEKDAQKNQE